MRKQTSTIFTVRLLAQQTVPTKQQGYIRIWKHKGTIQNVKEIPFDYLDELPRKIRQLIRESGVKWPGKSK